MPATGYRARVSLEKLASQVQAMYGAAAAEGVREEQAPGRTSLLVQVWGRYAVPDPVTITPPPTSQVADITSQVIQQARASSG